MYSTESMIKVERQITVDLKSALMTRQVFDALPEYSCSLPTGQRVGKRWKSNINAYKRGPDGKPLNLQPHWRMGEYKEMFAWYSPTMRERFGYARPAYGPVREDRIAIYWRDILIVD